MLGWISAEGSKAYGWFSADAVAIWVWSSLLKDCRSGLFSMLTSPISLLLDLDTLAGLRMGSGGGTLLGMLTSEHFAFNTCFVTTAVRTGWTAAATS